MDGPDTYVVLPDAVEYAKQVSRLPRVVLGVRWATWKCIVEDTGYTKKSTDDMFRMLHEAEIDKKNQTINLFIRGNYAHKSLNHLMDLYKKLKETNEVTITLYSDEQYFHEELCDDDNPKIPRTEPNIKELREVIDSFGPQNVYLQVSDKIRADLRLYGLKNEYRPPYSNAASSFIRLDSVSLILFIVVKFVENFLFH